MWILHCFTLPLYGYATTNFEITRNRSLDIIICCNFLTSLLVVLCEWNVEGRFDGAHSMILHDGTFFVVPTDQTEKGPPCLTSVHRTKYQVCTKWTKFGEVLAQHRSRFPHSDAVTKNAKPSALDHSSAPIKQPKFVQSSRYSL